MKNILTYYLPPILWILGSFLLMYFPELLFRAAWSPAVDKIVHASVYFVLCWLVRRAFDHQVSIPLLKKSSLLGAFIFCCVYGLLDEIQQDFLPGHSSSALNLIAGVGGSLLFSAIAVLNGANRRDEERDESRG